MSTETLAQSFEELIENSKIPVFVDFWAEWCGPCRVIAPSIKQLAEELSGKVAVIKVNVDEKPHIAQAYKVQGIPTLAMFYKGKEIWRAVGALPYENMKQQVLSNLPD